MKHLSNLKPVAWGLAGGAVGSWVVLAYVFGWTSPGSVERHVAQQSEQAVVAALAPVCADRFLALPNAAQKRATLAKATSWERRDLFPDEWVTLPGDSSPDLALVNACTQVVLDTPLPGVKEKTASQPAGNG